MSTLGGPSSLGPIVPSDVRWVTGYAHVKPPRPLRSRHGQRRGVGRAGRRGNCSGREDHVAAAAALGRGPRLAGARTDDRESRDQGRRLARRTGRSPQVRALHLGAFGAGAGSRRRSSRGLAPELDDRHKFGRFIWELSAQALGVGGDHLEAWRRLIYDANAQPGFAHVTIARGAIETSALCRWLVDPNVTSGGRIRRGVAAQLDDWHERDLWERASGADKMPRVGNGRTGAERMKELVAGRSAAGVGEIQVPRLIELCRDR